LNEAMKQAHEIMKEKNPEIDPNSQEAVDLAQAIGIGAIVFNDLKNGRVGDVKFSFNDALNFSGFTGPYVQFTHARLCSIERKFMEKFSNVVLPCDPSLLTLELEKQVLLNLIKFEAQFEKAVDNDEPSTLAAQLLSLAAAVSSWLTAGNIDIEARVLCENHAVASTRLALVRILRDIIAESLRLLCLKAPKRM